ncbi:glutathione S-transferase family protein [Novosphingobium sp. JCM 18896]|uniref:glutathione S-transferase family protein n=1 Tax=Novosphingobium sp. JCM 18896 TaxID=2989731 RepID=UPI0022222CB6|nr:glutathione S-transferase [Novosphingobium sp. JCM 18896]MCW1428796.1 glutathione S-transferase [Novosphingobium sp. JCM 18896]
MITVHHLTNSHSHVVLWLMEELGLPYEMVLHRRDPVTRRSPDSLRAIHPAAKAPTIEDNGLAMVESTGVLLYLLEAYGEGRLRPAPGTADAMRFYQWLTFIEGSAKGPAMQFVRLAMGQADDAMRDMIAQAAAASFGLIEAALDGAETIVPGQFTAADIQLTFFEELLEGFGQIDNWPNMKAHLARMREREAYKRAEAKGGAVDLKGLFAGTTK